MYLILFSIVVMVIQGILGLTDWWVLGCNWFLSALAMTGLVLAFDHERLAGFNNGTPFIKGWILLTSIMNMNYIYLSQEMEWWKQSLIIVGYVAMISVGIGCWQSVNKPTRSLLFGLIIALMSIIYAPMVLSLLVVILLFIYLSSYSNRNLVGVISGILFSSWIIYVVATLFCKTGSDTTLVQNFCNQWQTLTYTLPSFTISDNYTGIVFVCLCILYFILYSIGGFLAEMNSLRIRSNISLLSTLLPIFIIILPSCWSLYLHLAAVTLCAQLIFALNDRPTRTAVVAARIMLICFLVISVAELLIRIGWDYFMTE